MMVRIKVSDLITILTEVSKKKRMDVYLKYGFQIPESDIDLRML